MPIAHVGGSFAPPLTDALLKSYRDRTAALPRTRIKDALDKLLACCEAWWKLPEPNGTATRAHPVGRGTIIDMEQAHKDALFDLIPWSARSNGTGKPDELEAMADLFDSISPETDRDLRNAAFHLLWHVVELDLDREPMTADKL